MTCNDLNSELSMLTIIIGEVLADIVVNPTISLKYTDTNSKYLAFTSRPDYIRIDIQGSPAKVRPTYTFDGNI